MDETRGVRELAATDAMKLLGTVRFGRVVFSRYALPTIRPVNHLVIDDIIVIHAGHATSLTPDRQVVSYQADTIDHRTHTGWCVIVTGPAEEVTDTDTCSRYRALLQTLIPGSHDHLIAIRPDIITGVEYLHPDLPTPSTDTLAPDSDARPR